MTTIDTKEIYKTAIGYYFGVYGLEENDQLALEMFSKISDVDILSAYYVALLNNNDQTDKALESYFPQILGLARQGNDEAQRIVGNYYNRGRGFVEKDVAKAIEWFEKSAQTNAIAMDALAHIYLDTDEADKDCGKAMYYFEKAFEAGFTRSVRGLVKSYFDNGEINKLISWGEKKNDYAMQLLTFYYEDNGDDEKAFYWGEKVKEPLDFFSDWFDEKFHPDLYIKRLTERATAGEVKAQSELGRVYSSGKLCPANRAESFKWYKMASDQGDLESTANVGVAYIIGSGTEADVPLGTMIFADAYTKGSRAAIELMKEPTLSGATKGIVDYVIAHKFIEKDNAEEYISWLKKAAHMDLGVAQLELGHEYLSGKYVAKNDRMGVDWVIKAALNENEAAEKQIATLEDKNLFLQIAIMADDLGKYAVRDKWLGQAGVDYAAFVTWKAMDKDQPEKKQKKRKWWVYLIILVAGSLFSPLSPPIAAVGVIIGWIVYTIVTIKK